MPRSVRRKRRRAVGNAEIAAESRIERLPGVGKGIAECISEMLRTGRISDLERLRKRMPVDVLGLTSIEGLGPKRVAVLYDELGIRDVRGLAKACR